MAAVARFGRSVVPVGSILDTGGRGHGERIAR